MKRIILVFVVVCFISCSPKLRTSIINKLPALPEKELVVVLDILDDQIISGEKVGEIKATDIGLSNNCSYYENIHNLKTLARQSGANLIKLTAHKKPDKWSTCDRLWATIYKVDDVKFYETEIDWTPNRKLTWDDFKGKPDLEEFPNALAVTNSGISYESGAINVFKEGKIFIRCVFFNRGSWVIPEGKTDYVLRHEQIHFDITEIYSRMLRKEIQDANLTPNNSVRIKAIYDNIMAQWEKRQARYDYQTKKGAKKETQEEWEAIVKIELAKYELYKAN